MEAIGLPEAYILMNTDVGAEADVLNRLRKVEGVQEAFSLWGVYGIIARIKADSMDALTAIIKDKLHISKIHSKLTIVVTET
jgi:DNA-binding Lrp family transcriptional regulator